MGSDMRLSGGDLGGGGGGGGVGGGGCGQILCLLISLTLVSRARAQLDILAQKVIKISSSRNGSKWVVKDLKIVLVIRNILNEDIPP